jgi:hypothetical protein
VETVWTALPEFDGFRDEKVAAPVGRTGDVASGVFGFDLAYGLIKGEAVFNGAALFRSPCAELAAARTAVKVFV